MKDKDDNSCVRKIYELTQAYKLYDDYAFTNDENCHPHCEKEADSVLCTPSNDECQLPNWKFVLRKCTACTYISLPGLEIYSSNLAPMIMYNMYMTQFNCSHHGILIREKITTYLDAKGTYKTNFSLCEQIIQTKTPYFTRGRLYERVKLFPIQRKIGGFHK